MDALGSGLVSYGEDVALVVTPISGTDMFRVRIADERDAFTITTHPVEAAGWLLWHVRGYLPDMGIAVRGPKSPDILFTTTVHEAMQVAEFLMDDDAMEKPLALQHTSTSVFRGLRMPSPPSCPEKLATVSGGRA